MTGQAEITAKPLAALPIKPKLDYQSHCPECGAVMVTDSILWQGIHVCTETRCSQCGTELIEDLPVGQALHSPYRADLKHSRLLGSNEMARRWFGEPLLQSLQKPQSDEVKLHVEKFRRTDQAIILNCLDFLYGHALLKLLNADSHLQSMEYGLIVIVPKSLRWLVPAGIAEVWTVDLPLSRARNFYPSLHEQIARECERFSEIYLSLAHSHPRDFNITHFTNVPRHDFAATRFRVTFIWREDRPWLSQDLIRRAARRIKPMRALWWQNWRVRRLFARLRRHYPQAIFTVAGLGVATKFPAWIDDRRVRQFNDELERSICQLYAESRLIIGVHGSSLLLPSAHAGMLINLMPNDRWGHIAQDVLYQSYPDDDQATEDVRMVSWRYRYLPLDVSTKSLIVVARCMLDGYPIARNFFQVASK